VKFELTEQTRHAIDEYMKAACIKPREYLFPSRRKHDCCITTRHYARLVAGWIASIGWMQPLRHALLATYQSDPDLPPHGQFASRPTLARTHEDREHCQVSRHRGR
jgi:hypothetical protein